MAGGTKNTTNRTQHLDKNTLLNWATDCLRHVVPARACPREGGEPESRACFTKRTQTPNTIRHSLYAV
jgi:hypothetical protein